MTQSVSAFNGWTDRTGSMNSTAAWSASEEMSPAGIRARTHRKSPVPNAPRKAGPVPAPLLAGMLAWPSQASIVSELSPGRTTNPDVHAAVGRRSRSSLPSGFVGPYPVHVGSGQRTLHVRQPTTDHEPILRDVPKECEPARHKFLPPLGFDRRNEVNHADGHPESVHGPRDPIVRKCGDVNCPVRELKFECPRERLRVPSVGTQKREGSGGAARDGERCVRFDKLGPRRGNLRLGRVRAERHGATTLDGRERAGARTGRRQLDEEKNRDRKGHKNTNDENGRVAVPPSDAQAARLCLGIAGCDGAHIRLLAQIRNRASAQMKAHSAMIRVACKIPLWKMSV